MAIPQGDKLFHASVLGALPFYLGTKANEKMGNKLNPYLAGFLLTALTESVWELLIDPHLKYSAISMKETVKDFTASLAGASIYCYGSCVVDYLKNKIKKVEEGK
jgi:hypothetical protein